MQRFIRENYADSGISRCTWWRQRSGSVEPFFHRVFAGDRSDLCRISDRFRIEAAKHLLTCGNSRMSDIAFDVGYQDSHYFSYLFKKHVGVSPYDTTTGRKKGKIIS